jgi:hypothetical protein
MQLASGYSTMVAAFGNLLRHASIACDRGWLRERHLIRPQDNESDSEPSIFPICPGRHGKSDLGRRFPLVAAKRLPLRRIATLSRYGVLATWQRHRCSCQLTRSGPVLLDLEFRRRMLSTPSGCCGYNQERGSPKNSADRFDLRHTYAASSARGRQRDSASGF